MLPTVYCAVVKVTTADISCGSSNGWTINCEAVISSLHPSTVFIYGF
ncbi:MAG: hypothetical protein P8099_01475 [Gemmatimonadota bacterium]